MGAGALGATEPGGLAALRITVCRDDGSVPASHAVVLAESGGRPFPRARTARPRKSGMGARTGQLALLLQPRARALQRRALLTPAQDSRAAGSHDSRRSRGKTVPSGALKFGYRWPAAGPRTDRPRPQRHPRRRRDGSECARILPTVRRHRECPCAPHSCCSNRLPRTGVPTRSHG